MAPGFLPSVFAFVPERGDDTTLFHVRSALPSLRLKHSLLLAPVFHKHMAETDRAS